MDADGRIIPMVEDDQGEGIKDPIDDIDDIPLGSEQRHDEDAKEDAKLEALAGQAEDAKVQRKAAEEKKARAKPVRPVKLPPGQKTQVKLSRIQSVKEGDHVSLYKMENVQNIGLLDRPYKVQRIRPNGSVVLKRINKL